MTFIKATYYSSTRSDDHIVQVWTTALELQPLFFQLDRLVDRNSRRVREACRSSGLGPHHFAGSSGYGHGDLGRDALDQVTLISHITQRTLNCRSLPELLELNVQLSGINLCLGHMQLLLLYMVFFDQGVNSSSYLERKIQYLSHHLLHCS